MCIHADPKRMKEKKKIITSINTPHQCPSMASKQRPSKPDWHHYTKSTHTTLTSLPSDNLLKYNSASIENYGLLRITQTMEKVSTWNETPIRRITIEKLTSKKLVNCRIQFGILNKKKTGKIEEEFQIVISFQIASMSKEETLTNSYQEIEVVSDNR